MQPSFIPWAGFFNLIAKSDKFILLDDAQYQKNSWHNRNRILLNGEVRWVTMPVKQISINQKISESFFQEPVFWLKKNIRTLQHAYNKHPHAGDVMRLCDFISTKQYNTLAELNIDIILWLIKELNIHIDIKISSHIGINGKRTERLVGLLNEVGATEYFSPVGASQYLSDDGFSELTKVKLRIQEFEAKPYPQYKVVNFAEKLSILDVIANLGLGATRDYVYY